MATATRAGANAPMPALTVAQGALRGGELGHGVEALREALADLGQPLHALGGPGLRVARGGHFSVRAPEADEEAVVGRAPALLPDQLGARAFREQYGLRFAYVGGAMAHGIASEDLVIALARAGCLAFFGAAGRSTERVEAAIVRLRNELPESAWGVNLIHSPQEPAHEMAMAELFLRHRVGLVEASAYLDLTLPLLRYRLSGLSQGPDGTVRIAHRVMAKVSREEVARRFLSPAPERFVTRLLADGLITVEQARLATRVAVCDELTVEADSGGHTDNRPLVLLLPRMLALRDELRIQGAVNVHVGAAGGIGTPQAAAAAFTLGADYVVVGSVHQACVESGTSDRVRGLLADAGPADVTMVPAADMFELGVKVQVLSRGTLFPARARRLYEIWKANGDPESLCEGDRDELERTIFRRPLALAWADCEAFWNRRDPSQLQRAREDGKHRLALLCRAYLGQSSMWANEGVEDRVADYQVWCGPAMGAFNDWTRGGVLERREARRVSVVAANLMCGAAQILRAAVLRTQGIAVPAAAERWMAVDGAELDRRLSAWRAGPARAEAVYEPVGVVRAGDRPRTADEPIAIVGLGAMFPKSPETQDFWRLVRSGQDAVERVPEGHWRPQDYFDPDPRAKDKTYVDRGAFLQPWPFDPTEFGIPPGILEATDTSQLLSLVVAAAALRDAGCPPEGTWDRTKTSVILGVTGTQELVISLGARLGHPHWRRALDRAGIVGEAQERVVEDIGRSYVQWQENSFPGLLGNVVAGRIANRFDLGGTNCVLDAACASSLAAVHLACLELRTGRADRVLTGGVDALNDIFMHLCFSKTPALSPRGDARPFAEDADGTILGEGIGMVVLRRLADAEREGDRIYAVIRGVGTSSDGRAKSIYAPLPQGQARALRSALLDAGLEPGAIELIEAHGTGTKAGDAAEVEALRAVFGQERGPDGPTIALGSVKSQVGHTKAAAGAAGLLKVALALHHKVIPGTAKVERENPRLDLARSPFHLARGSRPWLPRDDAPRRAGVSSFGFGGSDFHLILEERGGRRREPAWDGSVQILAIGAPDRAQVVGELLEFEHALQTEAGTAGDAAPVQVWRRFQRLAQESRSRFASGATCRLLLVVRRNEDPQAVLGRALEQVRAATESHWSGDGLYFGTGRAQGGLAFLFPGQGSQHPEMGLDLALVFPEMLDAAATDGAQDSARRLWGPKSGDLGTRQAESEALARTDHAQPALALVERGMLAILSRFGVRADEVAGHSFGEVVALHAAGRLDAEHCQRVAVARGRAMAGDGTERGTMLAVLAPLAQVEALLREEGLDLTLANRNTPEQGVLSGRRDEIERAVASCRVRKLTTASLPVGAAFHSPLVADAEASFRATLQAVPLHPGVVPMRSCRDGAPWPEAPDRARDRLAGQITLPVAWTDVVERLHEVGVRTFIEVGPKQVLSGMVRRILGSRPHEALAMAGADGQDGISALAHLLARLAARGHTVVLSRWEDGALAPWRSPRLVVPISGANLRPPPLPPEPTMRSSPPQAAPLDEVTLQALSNAQEGIRALQALQEQATDAHRRFLDGQAELQRSFQVLMEGQQRLLGRVLGVELPALPMAAPSVATLSPAGATAPGGQATAPPVILPAPTPPLQAPVARSAPLLAASKGLADAHAVPTALGGRPGGRAGGPSPFDALLAVVSESTGYPREALGADMDLEADLGIDSIKRVEILSLLAERLPGAPDVEPEQLSRLRTLRQVADFMGGGEDTGKATGPGASGVAPGHADRPADPRAPAATSDVVGALLRVVSELTGYPEAALDQGADLEADLGIDSIKRVEILSLLTERVPGLPSVEPEQLSRLRSLREVATFMTGGDEGGAAGRRVERGSAGVGATGPGTPVGAPTSESAARSRAAEGGLPRRAVGLWTLGAAEVGTGLPPGPVTVWSWDPARAEALGTALRAGGWESTADGVAATLVLDLGRIPDGEGDQGVLASFQALQRHAASLSGGAVVGVLSIDGAFGLGARPPASDLVSLGLSGVVKTAAAEWGVRALVLDIDPALGTAAAAAVVTEEMGRSGPRERGRLADGTRLGVGLRDAPLRPRGPLPLHDGDLVVVSGGARGVTAEAVRALAREVKANFLLLGRMPEPDAEPTWLLEAHDEAAVKRALIQHRFQGQAPGPRVLGQEAERVLAARDLRRNLAELRATGAQVRYAAVDVQDAPAVDAVVGQMRAEAGPVRAVVHGAGVLRDRRIEDKTAEDWGAVWGPKVRGLSALLGALREDEPRAILAFTSVTGRVGRRGQVDYAAANEAVTGLLRLESRRRPGCRVASLDWGPWAGGMVTSGLRKQFEREGVEPIPLDAGARHFVDELAASTSAPGEVLIGEVGDIRGHRPAPGAQPWTPHRPGLRRRLDPAVDRWLDDHRLAGKPVLPMAVALEWLAEAACAEVEGAVFRGAEDVAVLQGIVLDGPVDLDIGVHEEANGVGERRFVGEIRGPGGRIHVRATLLLGSTRPTAPRVPINPAEPAPSREPCPAYGEELFHGPSFRVLRGIPDLPGTGFTASADAAGVAPTMGLPECAAVTAPLVLDAVFQAAILWCRNHRGGPSLPARVRRWEQYAPPEAFQNVRVDATLVGGTATSPQFDAEVVSGEGALLARLQGFRCTVSPRLDSAFQAREAAGEGPSPQA